VTLFGHLVEIFITQGIVCGATSFSSVQCVNCNGG
jgi:hypothetical protein